MNQIRVYQVTMIEALITPMAQRLLAIPRPSLEGHLPAAINEVLLSTGVGSAHFTAQGGKAAQGAQLH